MITLIECELMELNDEGKKRLAADAASKAAQERMKKLKTMQGKEECKLEETAMDFSSLLD
jgi:hypothetical protein